MKYALNDDRLLQALPANDGIKWVIAAFFFHDRGSSIQKSLAGMFQQILGSILEQAPELISYVTGQYRALMKAQRTELPSWDLESLVAAMMSIVRQRDVPVRIFLMLDALDEHHGDNDVLVALLRSMVDSAAGGYTWLKLCLASRSWTVFQQHFRKCPGFAIHDHTQRDIRTYIEARLDIGEDALHDTDSQIHKVRLINHVADKALGVFIWVRLVMDMISKGARDGTPYPALEEMASRMPQELEELYADTLRRVEPEYSTEAYHMLQITLCSLAPLSIEDFVHISFLNTYAPDHQNGRAKASQDADAVLGSSEILSNWITSRSGGLLEVSHQPSDEDDLQERDSESKSDLLRPSNIIVQFIHQTVKDYILTSGPKNGLINIPQDAIDLDGNCCMLRSCGFRESTSHRIKEDVFAYARRTKTSLHVTSILVQEAFLSSSPGRGDLDATRDLDWFIENRQGRFYEALRIPGNCEAAFLRLSIFEGFLPSLPARLHSSAVLWNVYVVRALLNPESEDSFSQALSRIGDPPYAADQWILTATSTLFPVDPSYGITVLGVCLLADAIHEERRYSCVKDICWTGAISHLTQPIQPNYAFSHTPLSVCVCQHSASLVRLLLSYGSEASLEEMSGGWDVLRLARTRGNSDIIQALLDAGFVDLHIRSTIPQEDPLTQQMVAPGLIFAAAGGRTSSLAQVCIRKHRNPYNGGEES